jgi:hypothetical protein
MDYFYMNLFYLIFFLQDFASAQQILKQPFLDDDEDEEDTINWDGTLSSSKAGRLSFALFLLQNYRGIETHILAIFA